MVAVPEYIANNAQRALDNIEFKGSGVTPKTLRETRQLARGDASENKIMRMAAWFARHETDLRTPGANDYLSEGGTMTSGQWAWLAWGGDIGRENRLRAMQWAKRYTERVREAEKELSASVTAGLKRKVEEHNDKHGNAKSKRVTLRMLSAVFERGVGAYNTNPQSVRPNVTSADQWAYARVNAFLRAVRTGRFKGNVFDTDLLPEGHRLSTRNRKEAEDIEKETKREDGEDFPAEAFAYTPDREKPSGWKLRLWDSIEEKETRRQIGMALAALGPGFRGNRVQIPREDLAAVKRRVLAAWRKVNPDAEEADVPPVLKGSYGDGMPDPLMHLLKAYRSLSQMGPSFRQLNAKVLSYIGLLETAMNEAGQVEIEIDIEDSMYDELDKDYGDDDNPLSCLLMAYSDLVRMPDAFAGMRPPLMEIIHMLEHELGILPEHEEGMMEEEEKYGKPERRFLDKEIVAEMYEGAMRYCVKSPRSGRGFGCYGNRKEAEDRLAQIERFADAMKEVETDQLVKWHDAVHTLDVVKDDHITVHDLLEDELEERQVAPGTDGDPETKLAMLTSMDGPLPIAKADERRYTLGPAYVPDMQDAHGEFTDADTLQEALWNWVRKGDRQIYLQHSEKVAGEMVEVLTWPFPIETEMTVPGEQITKYGFPANTPFLGVVWEPWAWDLVKSGQLRGYSIGGKARRVEAELPDQALV